MAGRDRKVAAAIVTNGGIVKLYDQNGNYWNHFYFSGTVSATVTDPHHVTVVTNRRTMAVFECTENGTKLVSTPVGI